MNGSRATARGFTKIELLVGIVCLLVLLGLLLPAVNNGRGDGRRAICASRLGQCVNSLMQYEIAKKHYPGYLNGFGKDDEGMVKVGTWAVAILPYIEDDPHYQLWADPSTTGPWNRRGGGASPANEEFYPKNKMFLCPSDPNEGDMRAPCSFAVNAGFFPDSLPPNYAELNAHEIARRSSSPPNSVFSNQLPVDTSCVYTKYKPMKILGSRADAPTRANDIKDGLTQTIAVTESINADSWSFVGHDSGWHTVDIDGVTYAGDDLDAKWSPRVRVGTVWQYRAQPPVAGVADYVAPKNVKVTTKREFAPELARPSSYHTGIFYAAMLGGSVTGLSKQMDYRVLQAIMTPNTKASDVPEKGYKLKESDYE